jgi:plasmid segregation protein ParM
MAALVRAVDCGYGATKYTCGRAKGTGEIRCKSFPSLAPDARAKGPQMSAEMRKRDTVVVHVDGRAFEVGPEVENALTRHDTRSLDDQYSATSAYLALVRGALYYMNVPEIDLLMVGLPVANVASRSLPLIDRLTCVHNVANNRTVKVHCVRVIAQPIGGFVDYANSSGHLTKMYKERSLIIDPGYFTLDWVVTNGPQILDDRSGHNNGGVFALIREIEQQIQIRLGRPYADHLLVERALNGYPFYIDGKEHDIRPYVDVALHVVDKAVIDMKNVIGTTTDIQNIVLVGGGAMHYREAVQKAFPNYDVAVAKDPAFANVRGFHIIGEQYANRQAVA